MAVVQRQRSGSGWTAVPAAVPRLFVHLQFKRLWGAHVGRLPSLDWNTGVSEALECDNGAVSQVWRAWQGPFACFHGIWAGGRLDIFAVCCLYGCEAGRGSLYCPWSSSSPSFLVRVEQPPVLSQVKGHCRAIVKASYNLPQLPTLLWCGAAHFQIICQESNCWIVMSRRALPSSTPNSRAKVLNCPQADRFLCVVTRFWSMAPQEKLQRCTCWMALRGCPNFYFQEVRSLMLLIRYTPTCERLLLSNNTVRTRQTIAKFAWPSMYTTLPCLSRQICIQKFARRNAKTLHQNTGRNLVPQKYSYTYTTKAFPNDETNSTHALKRKLPSSLRHMKNQHLKKLLTQSVLVSGIEKAEGRWQKTRRKNSCDKPKTCTLQSDSPQAFPNNFFLSVRVYWQR